MNFDEMAAAVADAERTIRLLDHRVNQMAKLVAGRLQSADVPQSVLCNLKKELQNYNMTTGEWK